MTEFPNRNETKTQISKILGKEESIWAQKAKESQNSSRIFFGVTIEGNRKHLDFEHAAKQIQNKHPVLRSKIKVNKQGYPYVFVEQPGLDIQLKYIENSNFYRVFDEFCEKEEYDYEMIPLIIYIIQVDEGIFQVGLDIQHFCTDGSSIVCLMHDFLLCATNNSIYLPKNMVYPPGVSQRLQELYMFPARFGLKSIPFLLTFALDSNWYTPPIRKPFGNSRKTLHFDFSFSQKESADLVLRCRLEQTSVTAAVVTAFYQSIMRNIDKQALIFIAADCRKALQIKSDDLSVYVATAILRVSKQNDPFWNLARMFKNKMDENLKANLLGVAYLAPFGLGKPPEKSTIPTFVVSSFGQNCPIQNQYEGDIKIVQANLRETGHQLAFPTISVFNVCKRVNLLLKTSEDRFPKENMEKIFSLAVDLLQQNRQKL